MRSSLAGEGSAGGRGLVPALAAATMVAAFASGGNPLFSSLPVLAAAAAVLFWVVPLRFTLAAFSVLVFLANAADTITETTTGRVWVYPFEALTRMLFEKADKLLGIPGLILTPMELFLVLCALLVVVRQLVRGGREPGSFRSASCAVEAQAAALLAVAVVEVWGLARGGDFRASLYQIRQLVYLPLLALVVQAAFRRTSDLRLLGLALVAGAVAKALIAVYAWATIFRFADYKYNFITSHSDSVLFAAAFAVLASNWVERRTRRSALALVLLGGVILAGVVTNARRLAFLEIAASVLVMYLIAPRSPRKRRLTRLLVALSPLLLVYLAIGWFSNAGIFGPVRSLRGLIDGTVDASTRSREFENLNLVWTFRQHKLLGFGFGHPYQELVPGDDLTEFAFLWRHIPHNSVLGFFAFAGALGSYVLWLPMLVGLYLAFRAYPRAHTPDQRVAMAVAASTVFAFALQAYGDMGFQDTGSVFVVALGVAAASKTAVEVGAWPSRSRAAALAPREAEQPGAAV